MPTLKSYFNGFIISLALTLAAYFAVTNQLPHAGIVILVLALIQLLVQLIYFLHLGQGQDGGWNLITLFSTFGIVVLLVIGSIWIMDHLNHNMTPDQMMQYIENSENIFNTK